MFRSQFFYHLQGVHQARTHTHTYRHYSHILNKRSKQAEKVVTALSTKDDPLKMVKQLWPKHVGF